MTQPTPAPNTPQKTFTAGWIVAFLLVAVIVVAALAVGVQRYLNNREVAEPAAITLQVTAGEATAELTPYAVCALDEPCAALSEEADASTVPTLEFAAAGDDGSVRISLPKQVYDHSFTLLSIYDDPAANAEQTFTSNQATAVDVPVTKDPTDNPDAAGQRPRLQVVEITSLQIETTETGEENPVSVTWSVADTGA
ncbi:MAG: DUF2771 family protein [Corynebacterium sp.]|nr:DUF2771 family protein [Corynebacterium sp.]